MDPSTDYQATDYIALAVPVFFLLIGLELLFNKLRKTDYYRFNDALTNLSCGIGQQVLGVFTKTVLMLGYIYLFEEQRFYLFPLDAWWSWVVLFVGVDFFYYWFHRLAHEVSFMWGGHIVHHQSEEYNLTVALRQGAFQSMTSWVFYLPLALLGFHPVMFLVVNQFQTLYQFWIHTKAIKTMGPLEWILNTPSHHRVHHGINPQYIDRNHGGMLIIWDRLFGTFEKEREEVVYGVTKPLSSWNPVWANFDYFVDIFRLAFRCRNPWDAIKVFVKGPGWRPRYLGGPMKPQKVSSRTFKKYDTKVPAGLNYYVLFQYVVLLAGATFFLNFSVKLEWGWRVASGLIIILSILNLGTLLEGRRWALAIEYARLLIVCTFVPVLFREADFFLPLAIGAGAILLLSTWWVTRYLNFFRNEEVEIQKQQEVKFA